MTPSASWPDPDLTRRAGIPAHPVPLADGRTWGLALPEPRYRPEFGAAPSASESRETLRVLARIGYPWLIERLVERLRVACRLGLGEASDRERYDALRALASALLRRAHDLGPAEAESLLALDQEGLARLVDVVLDAVVRPASLSRPGGAHA